MVDQPSGPAWGAPPPPPGAWPGFATPLRSLRGLAVAVQILLGVAGVIALVHIPVLLNARSVAHDHSTGRAFFATREVHDALDAAAGVLGIYFLVSIAIAVVFIIWMWRAATNVTFFTRTRPRFGPGFAIGGWFIPFANLVIPGMQMADIWRGSPAPAGPAGVRRSTALVWWWWVAFIVGRLSVLALPGGVRVGHVYRLSDLDNRVLVSIIGNVVVAVSAVLAIAVVRGITVRQESAAPTVTMPGAVDPFTAMAGAPHSAAPTYANPAAPPPAPPTAYPPPPPGAPPGVHPPSSWPGPGPSDP